MAKAKKSGLSGLTSKGNATSIYRPIKGSYVGVKDPATGLVYPHPRGTLNDGIKSSASVVVTNPNTLPSAQRREENKGRRLGMGGV